MKQELLDKADQDMLDHILTNRDLQSKLYWGLKELQENTPVRDMGICSNLYTLTNTTLSYAFVRFFSEGWIHHTGLPAYPVPRTSDRTWEGQQLQYRLSLIQHLIQQLESIRES